MKTSSIKRVELLLRLRHQEEQQARQAFADAKAKVQECISKRDRLSGSFLEQNRHVRAAIGQGSLQAAAMTRYRQAVAQLRVGIARAEQTLEAAWGEMEACRLELLSAMKQRKAMEMLHQRLAQQQALAVQRQETKESDEQFAAAGAVEAWQ